MGAGFTELISCPIEIFSHLSRGSRLLLQSSHAPLPCCPESCDHQLNQLKKQFDVVLLKKKSELCQREATKEKTLHKRYNSNDFLYSLSVFSVFSKVQARIAFSSYLQRVQQRLLAESRASTVSAWQDNDNDQMVKFY